ncbi:MAG: hypothetical protein EP329_09500 [Deltaproteobacteria bacterium]|nr:MAG: hypothetical protein EP329_09500 [Deltaproteobacteria bacterium]
MSLLAVLAVGAWQFGACGGDGENKDDTVQADTVQNDTTQVEDTSETDTAVADTAEVDTTEDTVEVDTDDTDTNADTVSTDTLVDDVLTDTSTQDTSTQDTSDQDTASTSVLVVTKHDNCTEAGTAVGDGSLPFSDSDDTSNYTNLYTYSLDAPCQAIPEGGSGAWGAASPDVVYALTPSISGGFVLTLDPIGFDPGMMVTTACGDTNSCVVTTDNIDFSETGVQEVLNLELTAGTTYYVYIMGWSNDTANQGAYTFSVSMGEVCDNGVDDNFDNAKDCADPLCADAPACDEGNTDLYGATSCTDGADNDADGLTDCADDDCELEAVCDESNTDAYPNGCSDGVDNENDGATDCADPDCDGAPNCDEGNDTLYPDGCTNVDGSNQPIDDDGDGLANCADPDCSDAPSCDEGDSDTYPGGCGDNVDNDGDGLTDCDDADCDFDMNCLGAGDTCADPFVLELDVPATYNTSDFSPVYGVASGTCPGDTFGSVGGGYGTGSRDVVFSFTPAASGKYHFSLSQDQTNEGSSGGSFDNGLYITTDCDTFAGNCIAAWETEFPPDAEAFTIGLEAGTTYFVIVDGWSSTTGAQQGQFTLSVTQPDATIEVLCGDTVDNDTDGKTDCADADCFFDSDCVPEICTDGIDNDNDGLTDCDDDEIDPATNVARCPAHLCIAEVCDSGVDDDGDGMTDCDDNECATFVSTTDPADTCAASGDLCALPLLVDIDDVTGTFTDAKNLCDYHNGVVFSSSGSTCEPTSATAGDLIYAYTSGDAPENVSITATMAQSFNVVLNVTTADADCSQTIVDCVASKDDTYSLPEHLTFAAAPNTTYLIMVDVTSTTGACSTTPRQLTLDFEVTGSEAGNCDNNADDDNDGLEDCFDPDCAGDAACPVLGGSNCDSVFEAFDEFSLTTDTCNYSADFRSQSGDGCKSTSSTSTAGDFVVKFTAPHAGPYEAHLDSPFDSVFNVVAGGGDTGDACPATPLTTCIGGVDSPDMGGVVSFEATAAGQVFYVVVDGYGSGCGLVSFEIVALDAETLYGDTACVDGNDNDNNGLVDCYDPACKNDTACGGVLLGGSCDAPIVMTDVGSFSTNSCQYDNDFSSQEVNACQSTSSSGTAKDFIVEFIAPAAGAYVARRTTSFDSVFNLVAASAVGDACPGAVINTCVGGVDTPDNDGIIGFTALAAGDTFYVIMDGWSSSCGVTDFAIEAVEPEAGSCTDEIDNDLDGQTDCDDSDCGDDAACDESLYTDGCSNDVDDDGDGLTDCDDSNCLAAPACDEATYSEGCSNSVDDDGDSLTDCEDWNCKTEEVSTCSTQAGDVCGLPDGSNLMITTLPFSDSSLSTCDFDADHIIDGQGGCENHQESADVVYEYISPGNRILDITLTALDGTDTVLNVADVCPGNAELPTCLASDDVYLDTDLGDTGENVQVTLTPGQHIYIYVNAWSSSECMPFELVVEDVTP